MSGHKYVEVSDATFGSTVLESSVPVVVDFWAPWCRPCLAMAPTFEALAEEYQGRVLFAKVNTDDHSMNASRLGIQGIPTTIFFRKGKEVGRVVGLVPREVLRKHIEDALAQAV